MPCSCQMGGSWVLRRAEMGMVALLLLLPFLGDSVSCWPLQGAAALASWNGNVGTAEMRGAFPLDIIRPRALSSYRRRLQRVGIPPLANGRGDKNSTTQKFSGASPSPSPSSPLPDLNSFSPSHSPQFHPIAPIHSPSISPVSALSPAEPPRGISFPPSPSPVVLHTPPFTEPEPGHIPVPSPLSMTKGNDKRSPQTHRALFLSVGVIGGTFLVLFSAAGFVLCRRSKVIMVKPWATGLSGQLQKAFVTGVPKLNRAELEAACEDFSNIIGTSSDGTVYKGTLSSGVEIAVTSTVAASPADWSENREKQFRKKIETLSKVNHKNFINLIGFCEEESPFTRMMVFEYAPNGTLFEHLHIKESEPLDWGMRLRIVMGISYCLDYMHQLQPPMVQRNLNSSSVYLTEDYAAKISDFSFWNDLSASKFGSASAELLENLSVDPESNVYSFGVMLVEIITGRIPHSTEDDGLLADSVNQYVSTKKTTEEVVDPTLKSFKQDRIKKLIQVTKDCLQADPQKRPSMSEVTTRLKEITSMEPDTVSPKTSPLWWAELEIMSTASSEDVKPQGLRV